MMLLSVNIARTVAPLEQRAAGKPQFTGIDKRPQAGPTRVGVPGPKGEGTVGLEGDRIGDVAHHGGVDQAVYAYAREDYRHWESHLGRSLADGVFGENLTTEGLDVNAALIGERWKIGDEVVLEVSCPRIPCGVFRQWMGETGWLRTFTESERIGAYLRVIESGEIRAGDEITVQSRPDHDVTVALTFRALMRDNTLLPQLLAAEALPAETLKQARAHLEESAEGP